MDLLKRKIYSNHDKKALRCFFYITKIKGKDDIMKTFLPMKLQFFAENKDENSSDKEGEQKEAKNADRTDVKASETDKEDDKKNSVQVKTLDDILKDEKLKAEYDSKVSAAVEAAKNEAKTEASEAQKLAAMSKEEREEYDLKKKEELLTAKEAELVKRELKLEAVKQLENAHIPAELIEIIDLSDEEKCKKSIEIVEKAFNKAVQKSIDEKLNKNTPVMKKAPESSNEDELVQTIRKSVRG